MMTLQAAAYAAQVLAALAAVMLAGRHAPHRPAAVALVLLATASVLHGPTVAVLHTLPHPIEGPARILVFIEIGLNIATSATVPALAVALAVPPERRRRSTAIVVVVWALATIVLGALYPSPYVRGAGLQQVYVAADLISLAVAALALIIEGRADIAAKRAPNSSSMVATALVLIDGGILVAPFSPWRGDVFIQPYFGPQLVLTLFFFLIAATEVIAWHSMSRHG
jgi:hypothetical protein